MRPACERRSLIVGILPALAVAFSLCSIGCQSFQDGARQVSLGAQDLGRRMSAPFKNSGPTSPNFGERSANTSEHDPFLPPPKRPDEPESNSKEVSSMLPRRLNSVTLGEPFDLPANHVRLAAKRAPQ